MGWFGRIRDGLTRTTQQIVERFEEIATRAEGALRRGTPIDVETTDALEELLISADVGVGATGRILDVVRTRAQPGEGLRDVVKRELLTVFAETASPPPNGHTPHVVLVVGVNGTGKTTTIAKLAYHIQKKGYTCVVAAADTFRAGAIEQLEKHAEAVGFRLIKHKAGADPAAVAFDAVEHAKARGRDVVLIDTAGRMQTNQNLMDQMKKIKRVADPNLVLYIGDALAGNDALEQAKQFHEAVGLDGIVLTKIDADAKGGAALSMARTIGKPVVFLNTGQAYEDIRRFDPKWMVDRLLGD